MTPERLKIIIQNLDFNELSDKEVEFLESCEERMKRRGEITEPMEKWVEDIWSKLKIYGVNIEIV